ncbi:bifunctional adenosylcobinamide kinase/adenosylcobinamide-phosphate guanylyltransferase [Brevibacillus aydinogluensis]|uniref:bifunctional adenosylcobinamide kinase/adenosylcobinamide-phosphate guanylyltransferase n=1 Tax=Brevibacillus aydinogluensis TaxID=927786 RepID=UPI0028933807|nr:bifunctional adenosylcobinamide kinase/adenosylcobinamide-phosphate guanylyltransferase [Brevibacillus aydinogluensis]
MVVTGGVRSGKSRFAEKLAAQAGGPVLYVATGQAWDEEMKQRIERHRARRPRNWGLAETDGTLAVTLPQLKRYPVVLLDCLSTWVSTRLMSVPEASWRDEAIGRALLEEAEQWLDEACSDGRTVIAVTSEVGLGGVAMTKLGRWFADVLGDVNQLAASRADTVYAVLAGIPWRIKG